MANRNRTAGAVKGKRSARQERVEREKRNRYLGWGAIGLLVVAVAAFLIWSATRPAAVVGDEVPVTTQEHVPDGSALGEYPSDPPAGGKHYPGTYTAGFYTEADAETLPKEPAGYLVHNLEHGYIIYWYNCAANPSVNCEELQNGIKQVMGEFNNRKVIGFPWPSLQEPLVLTSWGRILRLDGLDLDAMRSFTKNNMNKAPEPNAD
jgi:hypothetical protein